MNINYSPQGVNYRKHDPIVEDNFKAKSIEYPQTSGDSMKNENKRETLKNCD